jgi:hypothetical protein
MTSTDQLPGLADLLRAYAAAPGPATLEPLRRVAREAPGFRPDLTPARTLAPLLEQRDWTGALAAARALMPGALLSPAVHLVLAEVHEQLGDHRSAQREARLAQAAVDGILSTGDGTAEAPWSVVRLSDEYDVLRALGTQSHGQQLLTVAGRTIDRHDAGDGTTYDFDVTGLV